MLNNIKITETEMKYIQLLQNMTGATVVDCIIDEDEDTIIFTVKKGEVGLAVGKGGEKIKRFRNMTNKQVEIYGEGQGHKARRQDGRQENRNG